MNKICVIGARGGSKSILNKNLSNIEGKSLLRLAVEKAVNSKLFDKIYVSTDREDYIQDVSGIYSVECVIRPALISRDESHEFEYIKHIINTKDVNSNDVIARMQCTSPFQSVNSMAQCLILLENSINCSSVQLVTETYTSVYKTMHFENNSNKLVSAHPQGSISPNNRQDFSKSYFRSNFYCFKLCDYTKIDFIGNNSLGVIGESRESIDIDSPFDLEIATALAKLYPKWLIE